MKGLGPGVLALALPLLSWASPPGPEALMETLRSRDPYTRARAMQLLAEKKDKRALPLVRAVLRVEDAPLVQCRALQALGQMGDPSVLPEIVPYLGSEYRSVRAFALWALGELRDPAAVELLLPFLKKGEDPDVLGFAIEAVAKTGTSAVQGHVVPFLAHPDARLRDAAARTLGQIGDASIVDGLFARLDLEEEFQVQEALIASAARVGGAATARRLARLVLSDRSAMLRRLAADALRGMGAPGGAALQALLDGSDDPSVRALAARALGDMGYSEATPSLLRLLEEPRLQTRLAALYALERAGDASSMGPLSHLADSSDEATRLLAREALAAVRARSGSSGGKP